MPNMMQNRMRAPAKSRRGIGGVLKELFTYSSKLKVPSAVAFLFAVAGAVLTIIGPNLLSQITDLISDALGGEIDLAAIGHIGVILLVIYGLSAVFTYVEHYIMATVTLELVPSADRKTITVLSTAKSTLVPTDPVTTSLFVTTQPGTGEMVVAEMVPQVPGQLDFNGEEQGQPKILNFKRA